MRVFIVILILLFSFCSFSQDTLHSDTSIVCFTKNEAKLIAKRLYERKFLNFENEKLKEKIRIYKEIIKKDSVLITGVIYELDSCYKVAIDNSIELERKNSKIRTKNSLLLSSVILNAILITIIIL